ncbi:4-hydroxy-tetrahydrodipicolinate reductase [Deefgea salmonis]|uniref:4-hydroxy-tetrahydrodipicolinate reductase n=1 Tax=Deefgea salmonis TaxID=2875502 RepID=A0ABS8BL41_9NEIS|nr:4-hydroxy-tetrahydrodipicolinate reductase [Deefgea salmonis]MCB5196251.1 4-hydroxy-tetrahydrodipicolinate reductase [Deefgea salmonis]
MMTIKIAIAGSSGRMGRMLIEAVQAADDVILSVALDRAGSEAVGQDACAHIGKNCGVLITDQLSALQNADILIDFTRPEGTLEHLIVCQQYGVKMIIGTTGFDEAGRAALEAASQKIAIVSAYNMSIGVNLVFKLLEIAAGALSHGYDAEIVEMHHKHKVDAPSGTAIAMGQAIAKAWDQSLNEIAVWSREGITGPREDGKIGFATLRGGDVIGDHTVVFAGEGERIEITHKASNRTIYAQGSLRAARFLQHKATGLYDMQEVLGLK